MIAVNQDKLGKQARRWKREERELGLKEYFVGELEGERTVVVVFNRQQIVGEFMVSLKEINLTAKAYKIRDILNHEDLGILRRDTFMIAGVRSHAVKAYVFTPIKEEPSTETL